MRASLTEYQTELKSQLPLARDWATRGLAAEKAGKCFWAEARIDGETVILSAPQVPLPVAARYAYSSNPEGANLYSRAFLPAPPFRTDDW